MLKSHKKYVKKNKCQNIGILFQQRYIENSIHVYLQNGKKNRKIEPHRLDPDTEEGVVESETRGMTVVANQE